MHAHEEANFNSPSPPPNSITMKFAVYNGNVRKFTYVSLVLNFMTTGRFSEYDPGSNAVAPAMPDGIRLIINSVNMEPWLTAEDYARLFLSLVFCVFLFGMSALWIKKLLLALIENRLHEHLGDWRVCVEGALYGVMCLYVALDIKLLITIVDNPVYLPTNKYEPIFEKCSEIVSSILLVNFVILLLMLINVFTYYEFQPRLQIINKTFGYAAAPLGQFVILFLVIFIGFAVLGHTFFGSSSRDFASFENSLVVLFEGVMGNMDVGPTIGNTNLGYVGSLPGQIFFFGWVVLAFLLLMNIFIAILMDAYSAAKDDSAEESERRGEAAPSSIPEDVVGLCVSLVSSLLLPMADKTRREYTRNNLMAALRWLDKSKADPVIDSDTLEHELAILERQQKQLRERVEKLRAVLKDERGAGGSDLYHARYNSKTATLEDLAEALAATHPERFPVPDVNMVAAEYKGKVRPVPEESDSSHEDHLH